MKAYRAPADWDADVWDGLRVVFARAWELDPESRKRLLVDMGRAGDFIGAAAQGGPLVALQLREVVAGVADATRHDVLREVLSKAVENTEGDQQGLLDFAMALRDAAKGLAMIEGRRHRDGFTAEAAFLNFKAQALGLTLMGPEDAYGDD